jgi:hypothetical protein
MAQTVATVIRWLGRILILAVPYVLVCAFFLPAGIQFLNPVVCPEGLVLDNARFGGRFQADNQRLELVCTSANASVSAAQDILLIVAVLLAAGLACFYLAQRIGRQRMHAPVGPTLR